MNSPNHRGDGQNVVYFDAHVEFQQTPFCGAGQMGRGSSGRDNIFTAGAVKGQAGGTAVKGAPTSRDDSVMLPIIADGFQPPARGGGMDWDEPIMLIGIAGAVVLAIVVGVVVLILVLRKKKPVPVMAQAAYPPGAYPPPGFAPPPGQMPPPPMPSRQ